jgi:hypothetical protein
VFLIAEIFVLIGQIVFGLVQVPLSHGQTQAIPPDTYEQI